MNFLQPFLNAPGIQVYLYPIAQEASKELVFGKTDDFWVAVGTLALAAITTWSVFATGNVIKAEDRRHQQSLYPFVKVNKFLGKQQSSKDTYTLSIENIVSVGSVTSCELILTSQ